MFDVQLRRWLDPALDRIAAGFFAWGISANALTLIGAVVGIGAGIVICYGSMLAGLACLALNRLIDGLDGAVARQSNPSEWGGYLDSIADYIFYLAVPLGFAATDPTNRWPALLLISSFTLTAVSFLALAAIIARRSDAPSDHGAKAFVYTSGLMEGGETIIFFILMLLFPLHFPILATVFAGLCVATVVQRLIMAHRILQRHM
jgi:phosphatidylglycerophosphate synthase